MTESGLISYCISLGLGKHSWDMDPANAVPMIKAFTLAGTLSVVASIWSKTSFALTILRLTTGKTRMFVWFLLISTNIAMGFTALFNWIHCIPFERLWDITVQGTCWDNAPLIAYNYFSSGKWGQLRLLRLDVTNNRRSVLGRYGCVPGPHPVEAFLGCDVDEKGKVWRRRCDEYGCLVG